MRARSFRFSEPSLTSISALEFAARHSCGGRGVSGRFLSGGLVRMEVRSFQWDRMEGWLYLIRSKRLGLQFCRKRYFVLDDHCLKCFKSVPSSIDEDPVRSAIIDSCIRVMDNGRECIHRKDTRNKKRQPSTEANTNVGSGAGVSEYRQARPRQVNHRSQKLYKAYTTTASQKYKENRPNMFAFFCCGNCHQLRKRLSSYHGPPSQDATSSRE